MSSPPTVCRPAELTVRWIHEISEAISLACQRKDIQPVTNPCLRCATDEWNSFYSKLVLSPCIEKKAIQDILEFRVDYNDFRPKKK